MYPKVLKVRITLYKKDLQKEALGIEDNDPMYESYDMYVKVADIGGLIPVPTEDGDVDPLYSRIVLQGMEYVVQYPYAKLVKIMQDFNNDTSNR